MALDDLDVSHDAIVSEHDFLGPKTRTHSLEATSFSVASYSASSIKIRVPFKCLGAYVRTIKYVNNMLYWLKKTE